MSDSNCFKNIDLLKIFFKYYHNNNIKKYTCDVFSFKILYKYQCILYFVYLDSL